MVPILQGLLYMVYVYLRREGGREGFVADGGSRRLEARDMDDGEALLQATAWCLVFRRLRGSKMVREAVLQAAAWW